MTGFFLVQEGDRAVVDAGMKAISMDSGVPKVSLNVTGSIYSLLPIINWLISQYYT